MGRVWLSVIGLRIHVRASSERARTPLLEFADFTHQSGVHGVLWNRAGRVEQAGQGNDGMGMRRFLQFSACEYGGCK